jgi:hypothetical protein
MKFKSVHNSSISSSSGGGGGDGDGGSNRISALIEHEISSFYDKE